MRFSAFAGPMGESATVANRRKAVRKREARAGNRCTTASEVTAGLRNGSTFRRLQRMLPSVAEPVPCVSERPSLLVDSPTSGDEGIRTPGRLPYGGFQN